MVEILEIGVLFNLFDCREPNDSDEVIFGEGIKSIGVAGVSITNGDDSGSVRGSSSGSDNIKFTSTVS